MFRLPVQSHAVGRSLLLLAVLVVACGRGEASEHELFDIQETVVRWAFLNSGIDLEPPTSICLLLGTGYLEEDGISDPPPSFMQRFRDDPLPVRPLSACSPGGVAEFVMDTATSRGVLFEYGPVKTGPDGTILVAVGYLMGPEWGTAWECEVTRSGGGWQVERCPVAVDI